MSAASIEARRRAIERAELLGYAARNAGRSIRENPHRTRDKQPEAEAWLTGWQRADSERRKAP